MGDIIQLLTQTLGQDCVFTAEALSQRATSYWNPEPATALALLKPRTTQQVADALTICNQQRQPVAVQGGLTGCAQGADALADEVIISLERMNRILRIDEKNRIAEVEAGVILETFQNATAEKDLLFPLDLGARGSCTIGGNIATNAGGINVLRYGMMRNLVLGLEVVTAEGKILSSMNQMLKNNAGYDLKQLFIGSEGTLGIVTRAIVRLFPRPSNRNTALVAMTSFDEVTHLLHDLQAGLAGTLSAYEVMWSKYYRAVTGPGGHRPPMSDQYSYYVIVEAEGADATSDTPRFEGLLETALNEGTIIDAVIPKSESERRNIWNIREEFDEILPAFLYDISLPIDQMNPYIEQVTSDISRQWPGAECFALGHIADGNLHLFTRPREEGEAHRISDQIVYGALAELGGSVSAEHGIGKEKLKWLPLSRSAEEIELMRLLKSTLDPHGLLNPGRVVPGERP